LPSPNIKKSNRIAISGESYSNTSFIPKCIQKSEEQRIRIKQKMTSFLFSSLNEAEIKVIVDAMDEISYKPNEYVIKQGDPGNCLYVVESGRLKCTKRLVRI